MKRIIYLNAGHSTVQPGVEIKNSKYKTESELNMAIRDVLVPELKNNDFIVRVVPDEKDIEDSCDWVNTMVSNINDGLALSIHNNCCGAEGAESYYYGYNWSSKAMAKKMIDAYCGETGQKNRGAKSDKTTKYGQLGWIRRTNIWAVLIECGFTDNENDMRIMENDLGRIARALAKGVCAIYGIKYKSLITEPVSTDREETKRQIIELVNKL